MSTSGAPRAPILTLLPVSALAVLVHGYHLGVDDAAIYVPAIKRAADPGLYPFGSEFFMSHAHLSLFANLVGDSARFSHLPINPVMLAWHAFSIFLLLLACWQLAGICFENNYARWSSVALVAALLSVPVAGTALVIMDPYLTARSLSTPMTIFAIASYASNKPGRAFAWLLLTALIHFQMSVYGAVFLVCLTLTRRLRVDRFRAPAFGMLSVFGLPFLFDLQPARGTAREVLFSRTYFFVSNWTWYEWIGVFAPLALLAWFSWAAPRGTTPAFRTLARSLVPFGLMFTALGVVLTFPARLENYTRLQPMRSFHLLYVVFFSLAGGLIGEYALRSRVWRWSALFIPLAAGMWFLQANSYPDSAHLEWHDSGHQSNWISAFLWIRDHTPKDAVFALDPNYMKRSGEDDHGFRAVAERSVLADNLKDSGAVSLFPELAERWKDQVQAQSQMEYFHLADFENLAARYPVTWILMHRPDPAGLTCPYENRELTVCRITAGHGVLAKAGGVD